MRIEEKSVDSALFLSVPMDWGNVVGAMKPGAHLLLLNEVKTHHCNTIRAEDAGLEIRDTIAWVFGSSESIPEMLMVTVARKPLEGTVAENVLRYGTGGLNIDGSRVELNGDYKCKANGRPSQTGLGDNYDPSKANQADVVGRWPANLTHDNSPSVVAMFPNSKGASSQNNLSSVNIYQGQSLNESRTELNGFREWYNDGGSAARFFYSSPCLNDLLSYLTKLITPPNGTILVSPHLVELLQDRTEGFSLVTMPEVT